MLFNSIDFGLFFGVVFLLYWTVFKRDVKSRNIFLISVSYVFYGWWDWRFLALIIISSLVDFIVGRKIFDEENPNLRKRWLWLSLGVNLGFLGFFKYYNFFVDSFVDSFSFFGLPVGHSSLNIILPVGISFYTFQTMSYTLDIYYKKMSPTKDIFGFFAFVAFFPQLVAGPIERAKNLLPQFDSLKSPDYEMIRSGFLLMAWGLFKKIVIADRLARYVDSAYADVGQVGGMGAFYAVLFFAFQLYLDFSAYSDIAIGCARTLGFRLSLNFNRPYLSSSFSDFWNRWHISLSSWFRDYVYVPLGGNRVSTNKILRNVMIVFLLSGLWHGASWNFVIWGALNAAFIIVFDRIFGSKKRTGITRVFMSLFVSTMWALSLILFRAQTFSDAMTMFNNLFHASPKSIYDYGLLSAEFQFTIWLLIAYVLFEILLEKRQKLYEWFISRNLVLRWSTYLILSMSIIMLGSYGAGLNDSNFIYFQF